MNIKKFITFIIALVVLSSCLGSTVFAKSFTATFSDDFQTLYTEKGSYSPIDATMLIDNLYYTDREPELTEKQKETVSDIELKVNDAETVFCATIFYKNGTQLTVSYILNKYRSIYDDIATGNVSTYHVNFSYPYGNTAEVKKEALFGKKITLKSRELHSCDYYDVYVENENVDIRSHTGKLLINKDIYYYVDFAEIGYNKKDADQFTLYDFDELEVHIITDTEALSAVRASEEDFYNDDLGFLFDANFAETISLIFVFIVFGILPFALFILALIFAIRNKGLYKKLYTTVMILSGCELIVFAIIAALSYLSFK